MLVLIDSSAMIYRAFFGTPKLLRARDGLPIGCLYGVAKNLWHIMQRFDNPSFIAAVFDLPLKTFRHDLYPQYKANRGPRPAELMDQVPLVRELFTKFGIATLDITGYEADDLIATYARQAADARLQTIVVSPDKDITQVLAYGDDIKIYNGAVIGRLTAEAELGIPIHRFTDWQALMGDAVDNVPGIPKIGPKRARKLILQFDNVENVIRDDQYKAYADQVRLAKRLVTLDDRVPIEVPLEWLVRREIDWRALVDFLWDHECLAVAAEIGMFAGIDVQQGF